MLLTSHPEQSSVAGAGHEGVTPPLSDRLRLRGDRQRPSLADLYIDDPGIIPIDSTKTFVGPNGTYYDEHWRTMEWRGRYRSWNWAAALSFGGWLAYRKLYLSAALHLTWLGFLLALALNGVSLWLLAGAQLIAAVGLGIYGNLLYMMRFRRVALRVAQGDKQHQDRLDALARAGGTSRRAVCALGAAGLGLGAAVVSIAHWARSGFLFDY